MAAPKKASVRHGAASRQMCDFAANIAKSQAHGWPVALTLRTRPPRKVRGVVEARMIDRKRKLTGRDGESNLLIVIAGEEIPLESVSEVARSRRAAA